MTRIGIVVARYHEVVVQNLLAGARRALEEVHVPETSLQTLEVPGSFEIPWGVAHLIETWRPDGVIALGAIIQGETDHHAYLAQAVFSALAQISIQYKIPIGLGIVTTANLSQALERAGGKMGNKGYEAARAVLQCLRGVHVPT
ncbi:MAG: 6,7-dimethyl-8-ribityllumazine synthase [Acidobacteria bacterium]|nr:6,7-dimethyl-8-ribityllumazine synthase [Acidobacteriota bacterium]MDW7983441.1 6,7-dimethyl-8-ribityllumazine synthase [Acidobacteriota bacterium]